MLKFKIKEKLLALDKRNPQTWLIKVCSFTQAKAHNIIIPNYALKKRVLF